MSRALFDPLGLTQEIHSYSAEVRKILKKRGNDIIFRIVIHRAPIQSAIKSFLSTVSNVPYDKLFHLQIHMYTDRGELTIEKNEVINMTTSVKTTKGADVMEVNQHELPINTTVNVFLDNAKRLMGKTYYTYSASVNNCQDYIKNLFISILRINDIILGKLYILSRDISCLAIDFYKV